MVDRLLIGNHGTYGYGFYLSRAGVDVKSATAAADFIVGSHLKRDQIFQSGVILVAHGASEYIPWNQSVPSVPLVYWQASQDNTGNFYLPYNPFDTLVTDWYMRVQSTTSGVTFYNGSATAGANIMYYALLRTI